MNITNAKKYIDQPTGQESNVLLVTIDDETISVPKSMSNRHYAEIMRQVEAGELVIQEADS